MKRYTKAMRTADFYSRMEKLGFTYSETETLRRAEMTLHRWAERECNGEVERDEETGKCFYRSVYGPTAANPQIREKKFPVRDLETGAWKRVLATVAARNERDAKSSFQYKPNPHGTGFITPPVHEPLIPYHQTDPRGCALYLVKKSDLGEHKIDAVYNRGFTVCIG